MAMNMAGMNLAGIHLAEMKMAVMNMAGIAVTQFPPSSLSGVYFTTIWPPN
jgi:hypothetical protein